MENVLEKLLLWICWLRHFKGNNIILILTLMLWNFIRIAHCWHFLLWIEILKFSEERFQVVVAAVVAVPSRAHLGIAFRTLPSSINNKYLFSPHIWIQELTDSGDSRRILCSAWSDCRTVFCPNVGSLQCMVSWNCNKICWNGNKYCCYEESLLCMCNSSLPSPTLVGVLLFEDWQNLSGLIFWSMVEYCQTMTHKRWRTEVTSMKLLVFGLQKGLICFSTL